MAAGDRSAMGECMERYAALVWSVARRVAIDRADAEDAVQEIFISLWKTAHRFDPEVASEATFITMIARRRMIDQNRRRGRRKDRALLGDVPPDLGPIERDPSELADDPGRAIQALSQLRHEQRQVLELGIFQGSSHSEIAVQTGMPLGTVKSHARRGLIALRRLLDGDASSSDSAVDGAEAAS
ncbi:MAG: sigma-70 family RNA polymerase sigma factor [Planctomycetes bacterium]|nr:sigma-70 family RNA polymerase sigma factor [Planctomycetota bacterium]